MTRTPKSQLKDTTKRSADDDDNNNDKDNNLNKTAKSEGCCSSVWRT